MQQSNSNGFPNRASDPKPWDLELVYSFRYEFPPVEPASKQKAVGYPHESHASSVHLI